MISIQNVSKSFGNVEAVKNASLDIAQGEFFSLLGASGSGKTTLLRMIAGFESASAGQIVIDGVPMQDMPPHQRPVKMVFQNYAIFPHLNVRDNIAYGLRPLGIPKVKHASMVDEMLELIALPGYGDRRAKQLSGGQMQRVALARALILKPKVLLLDEPLGALDKQLREQMQLELRALQKTVGITFVLVTHDQEEAMTLSDKIAVMSAGKVLQVDTPEGLYGAPRSLAIASFIGNMNFFSGVLTMVGTAHCEVDAEGLGSIQVKTGTSKYAIGERIVLAIRPEKFIVSKSKPKSARGTVSGIVEASIYLGERRNFHVRIKDKDRPLTVSSQNEVPLGRSGIGQGCQVWVSWNDDSFAMLNDN